MTGITCFDSIENTELPPGAAAYAAYVDGQLGDQPNYAHIVSAFPGAHHLSIALFADHDADALDVEGGAASPSDIPGWYSRQKARGAVRPCIYANASTMQEQVRPVLAAAGIARPSVRLWTAHYDGQHICGPASCGQFGIDADGTQWTENAMGRVLDQSLLLPDFFGTVPAPPAVLSWEEEMLKALVEVKQGAAGSAVRTVQGLCSARGQAVKVDGEFGPATANAVKKIQAAAGIAQDGAVGPATWPALLGLT